MKKMKLSERYAQYLKRLPPADRQISNRMFKRFGWAFFVQTFLTALFMFITKLVVDDWGLESFLSLYEKSLVVYTPVFTAFLTKNTIENRAKIKTSVSSSGGSFVSVETGEKEEEEEESFG